MFNIAVVNIKGLIKYIFVVAVIGCILFFCAKYFSKSNDLTDGLADGLASNLNSSKLNFQSEKITYSILMATIPGLNQFQDNDNLSETTYNEAESPVQFLLSLELPIINALSPYEIDDSLDDNVNNTEVAENTASDVEHAETNVSTQVIENNVPNKYTNEYNGVEIKNGTNYNLTEDILNYDNLDFNKKDVMIFHTHTCESYTPTENYQYEESGTFRCTDLNYTVAKVGDVLSDQLISYGFNVTHDKTYHDYPAYSGSYGRSQATIENLLNSHSGTDIIIDLHRDAIADTSYSPSVKIGEETVSQLMFVIGTDGGGLEHPNWQQNLKFAVMVQAKANELYPGLFRPILLRNSRYNQQLGKAACIIEVGATGNTLEQSMGSMKYLAKVLDELLNNSWIF